MKTANLRRAIICLLGSILLLIPIVTNAQVPQTVSYQGYLTDATTGDPVDTGGGTIEVEFSLYDVAGGGTALWTSTQAVAVKQGVYSVTFSGLGGLDFASQYYLQVAVDENHNSTIEPAEILSPRQAFSSVPYALNAERLDGKHAADLGDITAVNPGTGITGGGTSGDVTISANTNYLQRRVTGSCAGQVIVGVNANGTVTCEPDDGITTETDPTVNGLARTALTCTSGQFPKWNGSGWACSGESDPQVGTNTANYVPKWNGSALATGTIYDNGNIGIGTTPTAGYKLDIAGSANLNKGIASDIALRVNGLEALWFNGDYFSWGFGGNANAFADSVGIGVWPPYTSKLTVAGTIESTSGGIKFPDGTIQTTAAAPSWHQTMPAAERFVLVMNNQAVLDKETGLVWERSPSISPMSWTDGVYHCMQLNVGGRKGWHVPTIEQLASLIDSTTSNPSLPNGHPFWNVLSTWWYWSATTCAWGTTSAWSVNWSDGSMQHIGKVNNLYMWCVRGGQSYDGY